MNVVPAITGIGLVTALGRSTDQTWQALLAGRGITSHARLETSDAGSEVPRRAGSIDPESGSSEYLRTGVRIGSANTSVSRVASLGIEAADQAIAQAKWNCDDSAVICGTSKGPVESWLNPTSVTEQNVFGVADFATSVAHHTGFTSGPRLTLSAACASGLHGLIRAVMMIQTGQVSRAIVVAAEASVHPLFLASFRRLGVLVPEGQPCRPFDQKRHGFLMSDAAAAICIEAANPADLPEHYAVIDRFAMGGDATHLTGSDPEGRVLKHLLRQTIGEQPMDLIHAHGTGTVANDTTELAAFDSVLAATGNSVPLYSHKAALGHSLGASGLLAVVLNCLSHKHGLVPPNINTTDPLPSAKLKISREGIHQPIRRSLIHAAGFGGPTALITLHSTAT